MSTVLIVDDEQAVLRALRRLLHRDDYRVITADSGVAAMELLKQEEIAVIVCDQRMPQVTGAEVLSEAYRLQPDSVRITLTGYSDFDSVQRSVNDGRVHQLLLKPWDDEQLRLTISEAVQSFEQRQEHKRLERLVAEQKRQLETMNADLEKRIAERTLDLSRRCAELNQMRQELERSLCDTVSVLAETLETHSPNVGFHSKRVAEMASRIALRLGLTEREMKEVEFAARLHELGRIAVPPVSDAAAPQAKSQAEFSQIGHRIVARVTGFEKIADAILHHSDPFTIEATAAALPLASRIIAVADAYDISCHMDKPAIVRHRAAVEALRQARGVRLDPRVVDTALEMFDEDARNSPVQAEVQVSALHLHEGLILARPIENSEGVLLLKEGTELTGRMLERIRKLGLSGELLDGVWVYGASDAAPAADSTPAAVKPIATRQSMPEPSPQVEMGLELPGSIEVFDIPTAANGKKQHSRQVLVVDDSLMICNAIRRELRIVGIDVSVACSGENALRLIDAHRFDAVIVDLMMPEMSGRELVRRLQKSVPQLKCVILTGNATKSAVIGMANEPNVASFLTKPWTTERLIAAIDKAIEGGRG
ncbi:MAG: response regulator [Phycisphaerales bacterium]|nr:response regulator [Phycisphaerales bacterium]MCB9854081.1 response regulator [Phycisphaerales bacterium]